jgi:phosphoribosylaminoimidazole-succinocarboxamide synthase
LTHSPRYQKTQTIHGLQQPAGLVQCQQLPQPIYTPSTKAELGDKDINISPDEARKLVGDKYAARIEELALACYKAGAAYAEERGIIIVRLMPDSELEPDFRLLTEELTDVCVG